MHKKTKKKMKLPSVKAIGLFFLVICLAGFLSAAKPANQEADVETCAGCHDELAQAFMSKPHSVTDSCSGCHGDAEAHMEEGGAAEVFAFKSTDIPNEKSKKCLDCHTKDNSRFLASSHGKAALDCTTCHIVHSESTKPSLLKTSATKSCYECHADVFSKFELNERHRLQEGILTCSNCHNPHEPAARERLAGFKQQACLKCHTDKGGPYLYEHGASLIEGCTSCHEVHGSPNRHMLTYQSVPDLCFSCHTNAVAWHSRFDSRTTNCAVCHSTIHGSNLSKIFLN
ncbi:cytochrome c3 family protein [Acidobacteriota bacterium]